MYRRYLKLISIVMTALQLYGCGFATSYVYTIGAIDTSGSKEVELQNNILSTTNDKTKIDIYESELTVGWDKNLYAYPEKYNRRLLSQIEIHVNNDKWLNKECNNNSQLVEYTINNKKYLFDGVLWRKTPNNCVISLDHVGRKWYGFPAQSLMLLSVPIDIAIWVGTAAVCTAILPFYLSYIYLNGNSKADDKAGGT